MLPSSTIKEAPALERILLMLIRAEETHAGAPENTGHVNSHDVGKNDQRDQSCHNKESVLCLGRSQERMAIRNLEGVQEYGEDHNCDEDEH